MAKRMLIDAVHPEDTRVVIADNNQIIDFDFVTSGRKQLKGNIYLAKVTRVEPSLQAAFVEYGGNKQGFLPFSEIHADYYQIPAADRKRLLEEAAREEEDDASGDTEDLATDENNETAETAADEQQEDAGDNLNLPELPEIAESADGNGADGTEEAATLAADKDEASEEISDESEDAFESKPSEGVETIPNEEEEVQQKRKRRSFFKRYKIQEVVRRGQIVLVQVIKEERGNKGASLTTYLSLAGRYCVLMPNSPKDGGVSRKIASPEDRKRLKAISAELRLAEGMSVIIRTAGTDRPKAEIKRDFDYLVKLWNQIRDLTLQSTAPALIYEESDVIKRAIRDQYDNEMDEVIVQGEAGYKVAHDFMKLILPSHTAKVKQHKDTTPLLYAYDIEDQLMSMHDPMVKLKSGGYLVMNSTEALIAVDVNSGRSTAERNIEETAVKTNLEAAVELGRQLRLRDLAGLIVIDFIDMMEARNRRAVEKALKDVLKADRAKIQLGRISPFGLLEMSRQRLRPSISETTMIQCPHCEGRGYIRSNESMSIQIIRTLEKEAGSGQWGSLRLIASQQVVLYILNHKRDLLSAIEQRYDTSIQLLINSDLTASDFNMEKMRKSQGERGDKRRGGRNKAVDANAIATEISEQPMDTNDSEEEESRPKARRGRRGGKGRRSSSRTDNRTQKTDTSENEADTTAENVADISDDTDDKTQKTPASDKPPRSRQSRGRGRTGGRKNYRKSDDGNNSDDAANAESADKNAQKEAANPGNDDNVVHFKPATTEPSPPPLPAFTQRSAVVEPTPSNNVNLHGGSTPRDPSEEPKRGWWQRMIQLDD